MARRLVLCTALAVALPLTGCTADSPEPTPPPPVPGPMRLVAFDSCQQLEADLKRAAKAGVGPYGFPGNEVLPANASIRGARTMADAGEAQAPPPGPAHSGTNNHEQDADEPDIVKTDGRRIVTVDQGALRVVDAATRRRTGKLDLPLQTVGGPVELLLSGDVALVLVPGGVRRYVTDRRMPVEAGAQVLSVDLTGEPRLVSRYEGEGTVVDARLTGTTARVVLRAAPRITFPEKGDDDQDRIEANRQAIDRADVAAWLPSWQVTTGTDTERGRTDCGRVSRPTDFSAASLISVLTFDLARPELGSGDPVTVVADGDTVYATGTSLYLASDQRWRLDRFRGRAAMPVRQETDLYRFTLTGNQPPAYAAAGKVPGFLINQYALSEWDGHLRVATTSSAGTSSSAVRVLQQRGGELVQTGVVEGLGKGEQIYSVRFIGPRGYVVTFRQTDPLYSVDLSDPAKPEVTGELKITGYSAHLQPAGDGRLIGVGQEADGNGRVRGTQVSLFDVTDPARPRRLAQHHIPGGQSEAEWDPHALLWWPATKLLVVPVSAYSFDGGTTTDGALALRVGEAGVTRVATLKQSAIRRSLVIGDVLWTLSDGGLQASSLSTMEQVAWLPNA